MSLIVELKVKAEQAEKAYYQQIRKIAEEKVQPLVNAYCQNYRLNFDCGMGHFWANFADDDSDSRILDPFEDLSYVEDLVEESTCDCEWTKQDAKDTIKRMIKKTGLGNIETIIACCKDGAELNKIINETATRSTSWGEECAPYQFERFPQHISK